jgi:hypothetical protein
MKIVIGFSLGFSFDSVDIENDDPGSLSTESINNSRTESISST